MGPLILLLAFGAAAALAGGASSGRSSTRPGAARRTAGRSPGPVINPRTERPWCELRAADFSVAELRNRDALIRWARCSTTTGAELAIMRVRLTAAFNSAASDRDALAFAQSRDRMEAAWRETHPAPEAATYAAGTTPEEAAELDRARVDDPTIPSTWNEVTDEQRATMIEIAGRADAIGFPALGAGIRRRLADAPENDRPWQEGRPPLGSAVETRRTEDGRYQWRLTGGTYGTSPNTGSARWARTSAA